MNHKKILIEGYSTEEILALPDEQLDQFIFCDEPVVFAVGTAEVLGQFARTVDHLIIELAHIDGGGEGVLPTIGALATKYARRESLDVIDWRVHAINCSKPNAKLKRLLELRGFEMKEIEGTGLCYQKTESLS